MLKKILLFLVFSFLLCGCTVTIHSHKFIDGKCDCGETTPNYVEPHEHAYIEGVCGCGKIDPNYNVPHEHEYINGICECGKRFSIRFGLSDFDNNFSPFSNTSSGNTQINNLVQMNLIGIDYKKNNILYGNNYNVVAEDVQIIFNEKESTTTYYFVLKNNVRFSNGSYLTIKDVLFNLYVYLDPLYCGTNTLNSVNIVGLKEYRTQQADETEQEKFMEQFQIEAASRIDYLATAAEYIYEDEKYYNYSLEKFRECLVEYSEDEGFDNIVKDFDKVCELFKEELETDYKNSSDGAYKSVTFKDSNGTIYYNKLTTDVEMFLYNEGYLYWNKNDARLESPFTNNVSVLKNWTKDYAIKTIYEDKLPMSLIEVIYYWNTATKLYDYLVNQALENYHADNEKVYPNIAGITFENKDKTVIVNGKTYGKTIYNEEGRVDNYSNEVLSIKIHNQDPTAIFNFSFHVAPMYYYSEQDLIQKFDYYQNFGVNYGNFEFMDKIMNGTKSAIPIGAGSYAASKISGGLVDITFDEFYNERTIYLEKNPYCLLSNNNVKNIDIIVMDENKLLDNLYSNQVDFIEIKPNIETLREIYDEEKNNYKVVELPTESYGYIGINAGRIPDIGIRQAIMHAINTQECVDYYQTTAEAIYRPMSKSSWAYPDGATAYYPYIGGPVPANLEIVNPDYADYCKELGKSAGEFFTKEEQQEFIIRLVEDSGYIVGGDGVYTNGITKLKYTFTIAGSETDHPAFNAFFKASEFLNEINFEINVATDAQALSKLASGGLAVWAAAWSSTIDPDMYQVYHKDSTATSTLNWGYKQILQNTGGKYNEELALIEELSELIEAGRETTDQDTRAIIYSQALDIVMQLAIELPTYSIFDCYLVCNNNNPNLNDIMSIIELYNQN